jgi:anti-anti-sigma factor
MLPLQSRYLLQDTCKDGLVLTFTESQPHADAMKEALAAVLSAGCEKTVLECQAVRYIDVDSLAHLVNLYRKVTHAGGRLVLCDLDPQIEEVLDITRLNQLLELRADLAAAMDIQAMDLGWLRWNDGTVAKLVQAIRDEQAFGRLPILADALEDSGCNDAAILSHCRQPGPHAGYCWVIDILSRHR